jgi:hypothetical protein
MGARRSAQAARARRDFADRLQVHHDVVRFKLPRSAESSGWRRLVDTNDPELPAQHFKFRAVYELVVDPAIPEPTGRLARISGPAASTRVPTDASSV